MEGLSNKISDWTTTQLTKFIQTVIRQQTPKSVAKLSVDNLVVREQLVLQGGVSYPPQNTNWIYVGNTGAPAFQNSWVNFGSPYANASYRKDTNGIIYFQGLIKSGTVGTTAFVLPPGYRPVTNHLMTVPSNTAFGQLLLQPDGSVNVNSGSNVWFSLSGIQFGTT